MSASGGEAVVSQTSAEVRVRFKTDSVKEARPKQACTILAFFSTARAARRTPVNRIVVRTTRISIAESGC
jgi:hypothetical protein